ncbi:MAG: hypothetical protein MJ175_02000, partial [Clostridia bacterium]|nr:hypothetical protein [Clostridia bacterium]
EPPAQTMQFTLDHIAAAAPIRFFAVGGNHDRDAFTACPSLPENLTLFGTAEFGSAHLPGGITVIGRTLPRGEMSSSEFMKGFPPADSDYRIVMLHGMLSTGTMFGGDNEFLPATALRDRGIDYLALGHLHTAKHEHLDRRCTISYPGCPMGRGFDECGQKGFVVLHINETHTARAEFVPFPGRVLHDVSLDITEVDASLHALETAASSLLDPISSDDMVRLTLRGEEAPDILRDTSYLTGRFSDRFFSFEVRDERSQRFSPRDYQTDISLRGTFLRLVSESDETPEDQAAIIRCGLDALK